MSISRQSAQRLVAQAMTDGIVKFRIDHPFAHCLDLAARLRRETGLEHCEVVPAYGGGQAAETGLALAVADWLERHLARPEPLVLAVGTGRTLRSAIRQLPQIDAPQHRIVSLTGNIAPDGSTAYYNVLFTLSERVNAPTYPLPMPVIARTPEERITLTGQPGIRRGLELAESAELALVGIGIMSGNAPLYLDGFVTANELASLRDRGAVGEIVGWAYDVEGRIIDGPGNDRVASVRMPFPNKKAVVAAAMGPNKIAAILGAIRGGFISGLITDETTAEALLRAN